MITTSMLRRQAWHNDDEFDYLVKNSQKVFGLSVQYKNHRYVEEFTRQCNVMFVYGTYALEGEADSKFSLSDIWNFFSEIKEHKQFFQANDKLYEGIELPTKNIRSFIEHRDHQANT